MKKKSDNRNNEKQKRYYARNLQCLHEKFSCEFTDIVKGEYISNRRIKNSKIFINELLDYDDTRKYDKMYVYIYDNEKK